MPYKYIIFFLSLIKNWLDKQMLNKKRLNQDSMSLEVNDRFFQSQSSQNQYIPDYHPESNFQQKEGISEYVELSYNNSKFHSQKNLASQKTSLLKKQNTDFESKQSFLENDKEERSQKSRKGGKKNPTSEKKKHNSKNYRERKKQFIQKLQDQHQYYKNRTAELQEKVILLQRQICELKYDQSNHYKSGYQKQYGKDLQFLKATILQNKLSHFQIIQIAKKLREKYGPAGHDRKMILNYYMSEYINSTMGDFQKYIFSSVLKKSGPFGESKSILDTKIEELLKLNETQKMNLTNKVFPDLYPLAVSYSSCCKNIYKDYVSLLDEANKFHKMMQKGLDYVVIPQLTKLVVWFEENKNMPQVRRLKQEWIRIFSGQIQPEQCFR